MLNPIANPQVDTDDAPHPPEGVRFGPYLLLERIGRGGMAVVYKAKIEGPSGFEKTLVVKKLLPSLTSNPEFLRMFTAEAKTTAQLSHPGIVHVYDFGLIGDSPYLVMEYLDGVDLSRLVRVAKARGERIPVEIAVVIATQICAGLGYAHLFRNGAGKRLQIIHGDVSPSNVMVCRDGTVKLLDFGVARVLGEFDFDLAANTLKGKFAYMAPEQVLRQPFDRRVDVFAAGIVLYELLTLNRLFSASTDIDTLKRVQAAKVVPPSQLNPEVPAALDAVVLRALERDPGARYDSGEAMAAALDAVSRVGGGRRRVAEYLERVAPREDDDPSTLTSDATVRVDSPPSGVMPLFAQNALPLFSSQPAELDREPGPVGEQLFPRPPTPPDAHPVAQPFAPATLNSLRPRSITQLVGPLIARAPKRRPRFSRLAQALGVTLIGFSIGSTAALVHHEGRRRARHVVQPMRSHVSPASEASGSREQIELPVPDVPPTAALPPAPARPDATPAPSEPVHAPLAHATVIIHHRRHQAHKLEAHVPAPPAHNATPKAVDRAASPDARPVQGSVKEGKLLDPFGGDAESE
jgi:serine/threonine protein kinase